MEVNNNEERSDSYQTDGPDIISQNRYVKNTNKSNDWEKNNIWHDLVYEYLK